MARLPTPGQDNGTWGAVLNEFLSVSHNPDGTSKDVLNARDFGAKGDNQSDDTAALQAWLDACKVRKLPGLLPSGTYIVKNTLKFSQAIGWRLFGPLGYGPNTGWNNPFLKWAGSAGGTVLLFQNVRNGVLENIGIDGANSAAIGMDYDAVAGQLPTSQNVITGLHIQRCTDKALRIGYSKFQADGTEWYNCSFESNRVGVSIEDANAVEHLFFASRFAANSIGISGVEAGTGGHFLLYSCLFGGQKIVDIKPYSARQQLAVGCTSEMSYQFLSAGTSDAQGAPYVVEGCSVNGVTHPQGVAIQWNRSDALLLIGFSMTKGTAATLPPKISFQSPYRTTITAINCAFPDGNPWKPIPGKSGNEYGGFVTTMGCTYARKAEVQVGGGNGELPIGSQAVPLVLKTTATATAMARAAGIAWVKIASGTALAAGVNTFYIGSDHCWGNARIEVTMAKFGGITTQLLSVSGVDNNSAISPKTAKIEVRMVNAFTLTSDLVFALRFVAEPASY